MIHNHIRFTIMHVYGFVHEVGNFSRNEVIPQSSNILPQIDNITGYSLDKTPI